MNFQLEYGCGVKSQVLGNQAVMWKPNRIFRIPDNCSITKLRCCFAQDIGKPRQLTRVELFGLDGDKLAAIG